MAHVRRQPRQPGMQVDALPVPARQAMDGEAVAQVVRPWPHSAPGGLETGTPKQVAEDPRGQAGIVGPPLWLDEQRRAGRGRRDCPANLDVLAELACERIVKGHPARLAPLAFADEERAPAKVRVPQREPHRLAGPKAGAEHHEHHRPERQAPERCEHRPGLAKQKTDLLRGEDVWQESPPPGQAGQLLDVEYEMSRVAAAKEESELPHQAELRLDSRDLPALRPREPPNDNVLDVDAASARGEPSHKAIEAPKAKLLAAIAVAAQLTLMGEKFLKLEGKWAGERSRHHGIGRQTARSFSIATRA